MSYERSDVDPLGGAVSVRAVRCVCVCVRVALALFMAHRGCAARPGWPAHVPPARRRGRLARAAGRCARALSAGTRELPSPSRMHRASHRRTATGCAAAPARRRVVRDPTAACGGSGSRAPARARRVPVRARARTQDPLLLKTPRNPEPFSQTRTRNTQRGTDTPPERHRREGRAWSPGEHLSARGL